MADVHLPGVGNVKKGYVYAGAAAIVVIVGVAYMRHKNAAASAAATNSASGTSGTVTDPAGNVCAALDPGSGYCPGSPEDEQYLEQQSAGLGDTGEGYDEYPGGGAGEYLQTDANGNQCVSLDPTTGLCPGTSTGTGTTTVTTNAQWVVEAEEQLGNTSTIQAALGYALSGSPVTAAQKNIFMEAVGLLGPPPQGYPPLNVHGSTTGQGGTVTVPNVNGERVETAIAKLSVAGLTSHQSGSRKPGVAYYVNSQTPGAGKRVAAKSVVDLKIGTKK
jgi:PASTA domain